MEAQATQAPGRATDGRTTDAPTDPVDYGALNAAYALLLAGVVAGARGRAAEDPIQRNELPVLAAATFAVARAVAKEKIGTWVREPFVEEGPDRRPRGPRGRGLRRAVGELLTCPRCVGAWSALGVVGLRAASPNAGRLVSAVLAASAANDFLNAGFAWLTAKAEAEGERS